MVEQILPLKTFGFELDGNPPVRFFQGDLHALGVIARALHLNIVFAGGQVHALPELGLDICLAGSIASKVGPAVINMFLS